MSYKIKDLIIKASNGDINLLDAYIELKEQDKKLKELQGYIKEFENEFKNEIQIEADKHNKEYKGYVFEFRNGAKRYDFKTIREWLELNKKIKDLELKYKTAWNSKQKGLEPVDSETGEILELPKVSISKSSIILKEQK